MDDSRSFGNSYQTRSRNWLSMGKAARYLGISRQRLFDRRRAGLPPFGKMIGQQRLFHIEELNQIKGELI